MLSTRLILLLGQYDEVSISESGGYSYTFLITITVVVPSTVLILCATAIVCTVVIVKVKRKKRAGRDVQRNQETGAAAVTYEEIGEVQQSSGRIDTTKNVAYCHVKELKSNK